MRADISQSLLVGETEVITSKSYYIRALILAATSANPVKLYGLNDSDDVSAAAAAIESLGARVKSTRYGYAVTPVKEWPEKAIINVKESATLLRILTPVLAAKGVSAEIYAEGSLKTRPVKSLIMPLSDHGITFTRSTFPLAFSGKLEPGRYAVTDTTTSGVLSGLITALPLLDGDSEIVADINSFNKGYIDITLSVVSDFGASCTSVKGGISVKGKTTYYAEEYVVEKDWSNAAAWLVAGALAGNVTVKGLNILSSQYDRMIVEYLSAMNAEIAMTENGVSVKKSGLSPLTRDMKRNLDIVPVLAVACAAADGVSELQNIERLSLKESDRITEIIRLLEALSVKAEYKDGNLTIYGGFIAAKGAYRAPKDHRIVMAAAVAGAVTGLTIDGVEAVDKSYPQFFDDYMKLGGNVRLCQ